MSPASSTIDQTTFRRILARNVGVPLAVSLLGSLLFLALLLYLLSVVKWVEHSDQVIAEGRELSALSLEMESGMRGFLNTGNEVNLEPYRNARSRLDGELAGLRRLTEDNPAQNGRLRMIGELQAQWLVHADDLITKRRQGVDLAELLAIGNARRTREQIRLEFDRFFAAEQQLRRERSDYANAAVPLAGGLYLLFTLAVGGLLAYFGRRELIRLSSTYAEITERQAADNALLQEQAWLRTGQNELASLLVGQQALENLGRNVLEFAARYAGSAVGALYVREDHGSLRRVAAYGLSPEALKAGQSFTGSQSLVGEAATQRRTLRLDGAPANYLRVNSGLGDSAPAGVVLVPIENEGLVNGVLELGFLRPLAQRDVSLLELAAPALGATIEAARYRLRLQEVLNETQQLNEELQVQQEELRTANEELEEQSRALKESQAHLESQQAELEQTNEQLSEQAEALASQRDALDAARRDLQERARELERASQYKSEFLANMSHELRTPLNSSLILAKLLADNPQGNLSGEQVKFAESIYSAGNDLLNLINDILDISKVEAGKLEVRPETVSAQSLADGLRDLFMPLAGQKGLTFTAEVLPGTPATLVTDRQRVEQILKNLLSNALKFTDTGTVSLQVGPAGGGRMAFAVRDSGIGIAGDQQDLIFEAFRQADGTASRRYGGTGLGLSISRDLAHLLGGSISVASQPGQGSVFTLVLPPDHAAAPAAAQAGAVAPRSSLAPAAAPALLAASVQTTVPPAAPAVPAASFADDRHKAPFSGRCILVVEDEIRFAGILYDLAHELGYSCLVGLGAKEGLALARQYRPDAVLLDIRLPDESGLTVLQRLKENPQTRHIPVHMVSVEDRAEAAMLLGAIGYAVKPATRDQLKDVFAKLEAKLAQKLKRVLLVEDDELQRDSIARLIGDADTEIVAVPTGTEALEHLHASVFDCMVIDLKLPDMQGNELLRRMSGEHIQSFPPVIVYTGRNLTRDEEAELLKYSRSIIIKGARSPERLLDEVTLFLHKVESDLSSERQTMLRTARSRDKVFEGRRILVVDDDVRNIFALTSALEQKGAIIEIARHGQEAIDKVNQVSDIDLVLMDVMMPGMDGHEATRRIRADARFARLPIIAVTAKAMKDDQDRCLAAGANDYLAKPIDLDRLLSLMRVWMPKMERL
jgi:signal transduction histidine kinase/CheY-like chemotaxis protein/CHASE3 domain sensor protein